MGSRSPASRLPCTRAMRSCFLRSCWQRSGTCGGRSTCMSSECSSCLPFTGLTGVRHGAAAAGRLRTQMLLPLVLGVVLYKWARLDSRALHATVLFFFVVTVTGIFLNYFQPFDWEGFIYRVGETNVQGAVRWWHDGGQKRLAGFARSSYDAAILVVTSQPSCHLYSQRVWQTAVMGRRRACDRPDHDQRRFVRLCRAERIFRIAPAPRQGWTGVGARFPVAAGRHHGLAAGLQRDCRCAPRLRQPDRAFAAGLLCGAYGKRLAPGVRKPRAGRQLHDRQGNWWNRHTQLYFEPALWNFADNLFVFIYSTCGIIAFAYIVFILWQAQALKLRRSVDALTYANLMFALIYGITTAVLENAVIAFLLGLACGKLLEAYSGRQRNFSVSRKLGMLPKNSGYYPSAFR